jgi:hypothetical protein
LPFHAPAFITEVGTIFGVFTQPQAVSITPLCQPIAAMKHAVVFASLLLIASPTIAAGLPDTTSQSTPDQPEEVLRTEVITGARSPLDNKPLTATQYAELQTEITRLNQVPAKLSDKTSNLIALLKLRKFIKTVLPFIPIK